MTLSLLELLLLCYLVLLIQSMCILSWKILEASTTFFGMEVTSVEDFMILNQKKFVQELIAKVGLLNMSSFYMYGCLFWTLSQWNLVQKYNSVLQHVCVTRTDIHFVVKKLSQYMQIPYTIHWKAVLHVLRYLKGTVNHGLLLQTNPSPTNDMSLVSYSDVIWGGDIVDRRSISGHYLLQNGNPIVLTSLYTSFLYWSSAHAYLLLCIFKLCY